MTDTTNSNHWPTDRHVYGATPYRSGVYYFETRAAFDAAQIPGLFHVERDRVDPEFRDEMERGGE